MGAFIGSTVRGFVKLTVEEFERVDDSDPLALFNQGIKSDKTREKYTRTLRNVLCHMLEDILKGTFEERAEQFVRQGREDPGWARDLILSISRKLRERTTLAPDHPQYLNPVSFSGYFKPVKKLLDMNDVMISWKRVYATFPEEYSQAPDSRGWERAEIQQMLRFCRGPIEKAVILVCASSGIRIGGFEGLEWRDLTPVFRKPGGGLRLGDDTRDAAAAPGSVCCAKLQIYRGSAESYPAFITPEAYGALSDYVADWTSRVGRAPGPRDPMFIKAGYIPARISTLMIKKHVERVVARTGLRPPSTPAGTRRHEVPALNGFRRFWNKACKESMSGESALASLIKKEYMMGHAGLVKLDRNYFKAHVLELAEEYLHSVPALTIDDSERLRLENAGQSRRINEMQGKQEAEIARLKRMVEAMAKRMGAGGGAGRGEGASTA